MRTAWRGESRRVLSETTAAGRLEKKEQLSYALAVGLLARIELNHKREARELYANYRDVAFASGPSLVFRLLTTLAEE